MNQTLPQIAVVGAGAVGCYFGGLLARSGALITFIGRPQHVEAMRSRGLRIESIDFSSTIAVSASTELSAAANADLVLLCVKTVDTEPTMRALQAILPPGAVVVSMQNGVDNVERIRSACGMEAVPAVVYVGASMRAPGVVRHVGGGRVVLGHAAVRPGQTARLTSQAIANLFTYAGVPCRISDNIQGEMWRKLIMNCAYNAISALCRAKYGLLAGNPDAKMLMKDVTEEVVAVAKAAGVVLPEENILEVVWSVGSGMLEATSSTSQDIQRGKQTEIDSLNGYVVRMGERLGVPVPVNRTLTALVRILEQSVTATQETVAAAAKP